jgi:hypothetical protein
MDVEEGDGLADARSASVGLRRWQANPLNSPNRRWSTWRISAPVTPSKVPGQARFVAEIVGQVGTGRVPESGRIVQTGRGGARAAASAFARYRVMAKSDCARGGERL